MLFHERGHALHSLLSQSPLPSFGGVNGPADYIEMPSQIMERYFTHPDLMCKHLRHHETHKPMSKSMARAVQKHLRYRSGTHLLSKINDSLLDLELYQHGHARINVHNFEREVRTRHGIDPDYYMFPVLPVHWHIMVGYASQYYSYIWSEALAADALEPYQADPLNPKLGRKLEREVMSKGISRTPEENFKALRGRDPDAGALLRHYGLI
jgi:peptidyl-dipeptidase Dcp